MLPVNSDSLLLEDPSEAAEDAAARELQRRFIDWHLLFRAHAAMHLMAWDQHDGDLLAFELYQLHYNIPARELIGTTHSTRLMSEYSRCGVCDSL